MCRCALLGPRRGAALRLHSSDAIDLVFEPFDEPGTQLAVRDVACSPCGQGRHPRVAHDRSRQASRDQRPTRRHIGCDSGYLGVNRYGEVRNTAAVVTDPLDRVGRLVLDGAINDDGIPTRCWRVEEPYRSLTRRDLLGPTDAGGRRAIHDATLHLSQPGARIPPDPDQRDPGIFRTRAVVSGGGHADPRPSSPDGEAEP